MLSLNLDYKALKTDLCVIGAKYDTDSSSQRENVSAERHCHPYTIFYDSMFKHMREAEVSIAEIGVGGSTRMWTEYFKNSKVYGFDTNTNVDISGVIMTEMNVNHDDSIKGAFSTVGQMYDLIIEDTTHFFDDQLKVIKNSLDYLNPGGMIVLQSVYKHYEEWWYAKLMADILEEFQEKYFITFKHERQCSTGWDNDKILVLVKKGEKVFKQQNKMTIITPSSRPHNWPTVRNSINFDYVHEWIIVYDGSKIGENPNVFLNEG